MIMNEGLLEAGMVIKLVSGETGWVEYVTDSAARVHYVSRFEKPITTRKGVTKMVMARKDPIHISRTALVEILDPGSRYVERIQERMMSETQSASATETPASAPARAQQVYTRTSKAPEKPMRGQGAIVLEALDRVKAGTLSDITAECKGKFTGSRQGDDRIVGYYLSQFKRKGLVSTGNSPSTEGEAAPETAAE